MFFFVSFSYCVVNVDFEKNRGDDMVYEKFVFVFEVYEVFFD